MDKYHELSAITKTFLDGDLQKLSVEYENTRLVHLQMIYEDASKYQFDYEVDVDLGKHQIIFFKHVLTNPFEQTNIRRNKEFEHALEDYLLDHHHS